MTKILILYHCEANTGYAIGSLEKVFWSMALRLAGSPDNIHLCYPGYSNGYPGYTPEGFGNFVEFSDRQDATDKIELFASYLKENNINVIFGFDQPVSLPYYKAARLAGVSSFISYWGAPMSSINSGLKLLLKKLDVMRYRHGPDLYIFESEAMRQSAYLGRGVPEEKTALCHLGVDTEKYHPDAEDQYYAHDLFGIPRDKQLLFYSGHFEERKGVRVIAEAANIIAAQRDDIVFILFGNRNDEAAPYQALLNEKSSKQVIFGGYRSDLHRVHRSCKAGIIASTGWDSFTMSSIEMQASGLPLLVSNLQGLRETIVDGETGLLFSPGSAAELAERVQTLLGKAINIKKMSQNAVSRIQSQFSTEIQIQNLTSLTKQQLTRSK
ncbi:glycosyltransferase [Hahella sp. KA22]|uniref:glycosyltransferase family 4 protein n=1 Tax=Hahella sp. KA22 TaxID=1628392 RepID=UPI000FDD7930|nr:glycosyltransferase family 4 protein [Hahella sp. KA22]AZZ92986.1 glycosyltransferase [Hahella sp. KA22]QAY56360.1 glycosyltransferase [Hahella sp. KA22]